MSKFFVVTLTYTAIVRAEDESEAVQFALDDRRDIVSDSPAPQVDIEDEIETLAQANRFGWDGMCIPYGNSNGNTRLKEYLPE